MEPLSCHLLIGPPASGKTTTAQALAPLLSGPDGQSAVVLSTDAIRAEVFGDPAVQGPWPSIQQRLYERLIGAVAAGMPVVVDATHAKRPWRLEITQQLALPRCVQWIGWWHFTPLSTCLRWNKKRPRPVPDPVIRTLAASLADEAFGPGRSEGFASVVAVQPTHQADLSAFLRGELARLNRRISAASNRQHQLQLHGHSRLLDLERLLFLLQLLAEHPDLATSDQGSREALEMLVSPLPSGDFSERAAILLRTLHGTCYGDADAVRRDLRWLEDQGFFSAIPVTTPITPLPLQPLAAGEVPSSGGIQGGHPPMADAVVFIRVMTLLRHLLQTPFDRPVQGPGEQAIQRHLLQRLAQIPGGHAATEMATLRKDIEKILTPYGFRLRPDNSRRGYCLGTALLSASRLVEVHGVVQHFAQRLGDPTAQDLLRELEQRLAWAGIDVQATPPLRSYLDGVSPSVDALRQGRLADPTQAERIETAILEHRRVRLERHPAHLDEGRAVEIRIWPLQLILSGGFWHLAWEDDAIGRPHGLLQCERLERLVFLHAESRGRRNEDEHQRALARLHRLLHLCAGVELGSDIAAQDVLCRGTAEQRRRHLQTLRFSCTTAVYQLICDGQLPFPQDQIRVQCPVDVQDHALPGGEGPGTVLRHPALEQSLAPHPCGGRYSHCVEVDLPPWILSRGIALRRWVFSHGCALRIDAPEALRQEQLGQALQILAMGRPCSSG